MNVNYDDLKLPPIYKRNGRECYLDSIRQKLIYITPEESCRQKVISYLVDYLDVPKELISVEEHLSHYGVNSKLRADIVIHRISDDELRIPIAVVECKAPDIPLDENGTNQLLGYCDLLETEYGMLTNGYEAFIYKYNCSKSSYEMITELPSYKKMLEGEYEVWEKGEFPPRIPFEKLEEFLEDNLYVNSSDSISMDISAQTKKEIAIPALNLLEGFYDIRKKMPTGDYGYFKLIEDYGVRMLTYGNASGGKFYAPYRSLLVDVNGSTEFVSFNITTYSKSSNPDNVKTCLVVAIDNEEESHHALQMVLDDNLLVDGSICKFYHHGRIAIGKIGSGKIDELRMFIAEKSPNLIEENKFLLGSLLNDRLWGMDDPEVIKLIVNLVAYSFIRDEYRNYVKEKRK